MNDGCEKEVEVEDVQVRECRECLRRRFMNGDSVSQKKRQKNLFSCSNARSHQMFQTRGVARDRRRWARTRGASRGSR